MWNLQSEQDGKRLYVNSVTGGKCTTSKVYKDNQGNDWYGFDDLIAMPFTRQFATSKVMSLYTLGLTPDDINNYFTKHKATLKSQDDGEKYERAYAETLDFENMVKNAADPIRQLSSLVCVFYMIADEPIDAFENSLQLKKLGILEADPTAHSFFLSQLIPVIEDYMMRLNKLSRIALPQLQNLQEASQ